MYHKIVLICLIVANILNLFLDRGGLAGGRVLIYVANGITLLTIAYYLLVKPLKFPKCFRPLKWFLALFIIMLIIQFYWPNRYFIFNMYIKWLLSLFLLFFFYTYEQNKKNNWLMQLYTVTFIAECCYKVYMGRAFGSVADASIRSGGDTASIGLALAVPLIFTFFSNKKGLILYTICMIFCLFSLRRTSILALLVAVPFIWPILKQHVSKKYLALGFVIALIFIFRAWDYVGDRVIKRFFEGHSSYESMEFYGGGGYGSGRSEFWKFLFDKYVENENYLFGNGMGSIREVCFAYWRIGLSHAHSDVFELLYSFGFFGLLFWGLFWIKTTIYVVKSKLELFYRKNFFCAILIYLVVGATSGALIRAEMFPMAIAIPILLQPLRNTETATVEKLSLWNLLNKR